MVSKITKHRPFIPFHKRTNEGDVLDGVNQVLVMARSALKDIKAASDTTKIKEKLDDLASGMDLAFEELVKAADENAAAAEAQRLEIEAKFGGVHSSLGRQKKAQAALALKTEAEFAALRDALGIAATKIGQISQAVDQLAQRRMDDAQSLQNVKDTVARLDTIIQHLPDIIAQQLEQLRQQQAQHAEDIARAQMEHAASMAARNHPQQQHRTTAATHEGGWGQKVVQGVIGVAGGGALWWGIGQATPFLMQYASVATGIPLSSYIQADFIEAAVALTIAARPPGAILEFINGHDAARKTISTSARITLAALAIFGAVQHMKRSMETSAPVAVGITGGADHPRGEVVNKAFIVTGANTIFYDTNNSATSERPVIAHAGTLVCLDSSGFETLYYTAKVLQDRQWRTSVDHYTVQVGHGTVASGMMKGKPVVIPMASLTPKPEFRNACDSAAPALPSVPTPPPPPRAEPVPPSETVPTTAQRFLRL